MNNVIPAWPETISGWPAFTSSDPEVERILRDLFDRADGPTCAIRLEVSDPSAVIAGDGLISWTVDDEVQEQVDLAEVLFRAVGLLNRRALDADPDRLHLHAALVGDDHGRTLLIPGARGAGKTTLTSALLDRGWSYGTDEMVAIEQGGTATALRKPLNCKPGSLTRFAHVRGLLHPSLAHWSTDRAQLGVPPRWLPAGPSTVTDVVVPTHSNRYATPHLTPLRAADTVRILLENTFDFERHGPSRSLDLAVSLVGRVRAWTLLHNDAETAAALLEDELVVSSESTASTPRPPDVVAVPALDHARSGPHARQAAGSLGLAIDGHGLIWVPDLDRIVQVSPPAFAAWASADGSTSTSDRATLLDAPLTDLERVDAELAQNGIISVGAQP